MCRDRRGDDVKWGRSSRRCLRGPVSKFVRGVTCPLWYSATDTDVFTDPYNVAITTRGFGGDPHPPSRRADSETAYRFSLCVDARRRAGHQTGTCRSSTGSARNAGVLLDRDQGSNVFVSRDDTAFPMGVTCAEPVSGLR